MAICAARLSPGLIAQTLGGLASVLVVDGSLDITYSSIVDGASNYGVACVDCIGSVRNSVITSGDTDHPVLMPEEGFEVVRNVLDEPIEGNRAGIWNPVYYVNPQAFNYHLASYNTFQFRLVAEQQEGDPEVDIDGDPMGEQPLVGHDQPPVE